MEIKLLKEQKCKTIVLTYILYIIFHLVLIYMFFHTKHRILIKLMSLNTTFCTILKKYINKNDSKVVVIMLTCSEGQQHVNSGYLGHVL